MQGKRRIGLFSSTTFNIIQIESILNRILFKLIIYLNKFENGLSK